MGGQRWPRHWDDPDDDRASEDAYESSYYRQHDRLKRELQKNISPARSDRLPDSDLARSFGHGHQHNVHHTHAAHDQPHTGDCEHPDKKTTCTLIPHLGDRFLGKDSEVVLLVEGDLSSASQYLTNLVHRFGQIVMRCRFDNDPVLLHLRMQRFEGPEREKHPVVDWILASIEHRLDLADGTDNPEQSPLDINLFAEWLLAPKQFLSLFIAKCNDRE